MNYLTTVNLVLILFLSLGLIIYVTVRIVFTREYLNYQTPRISSSAQVISSHELQAMLNFFREEWDLNDYQVVIQEQKFLNSGRNLKRKKHEIIISQRLFESLGYEIDYFLSRLWFSSQQVKKNRSVRAYSLIANYLIFTLTIIYLLGYTFQMLFFIAMIIVNPDSVNNKFLLFLWKIPMVAIIALVVGTIIIGLLYSLNELKKTIELDYTHDTFPLLNNNFITYRDDFKIARQYAIENKTAYNFSFRFNKNSVDSVKWLGPFVKY